MITRYQKPKPMSKARARNFVALDNLTAQMPLIELTKVGRRKCIRIWTAYDYEKECGTYTAVFFDGMVATITQYPGGRRVEKINRPRD